MERTIDSIEIRDEISHHGMTFEIYTDDGEMLIVTESLGVDADGRRGVVTSYINEVNVDDSAIYIYPFQSDEDVKKASQELFDKARNKIIERLWGFNYSSKL